MTSVASNGRLESWKTLCDIAQSLATILALVIGGMWTYKNFVAQRENHPRLQLTVSVSDVTLSSNQRLVIIDENLLNLGSRLIKLRAGEIRIIQVLPVPETIATQLKSLNPLPAIVDPKSWPVFNDHQHKYEPSQAWGENDHVIEPGERDQIHTEVVIPANVTVVGILAYVFNPTGNPHKPQGWQVIRLYDVRKHALLPGIKSEDSEKSSKD